jgi:hypothetical protein
MFANLNIKILFAALTALLITAGCGSDSLGPQTAKVRVLHAVADAPRVNIYLDDEEVLTNVDFRTGSEYLQIPSGTYDVRVEAIVPGGNIDVITVDNFVFEAGTRSTLAAVGDVSEMSIAPLPIAEPTEDIAAGNIRLRATHASPDAPPVFLAITTPNLPIDQAALLGPLSYQETTVALELPAGDYQVRVTLKGQPLTDDDVVYDSGTLPLPAGADLHAFAVTSTVPSTQEAGSPISVVVLDGAVSADVFDTNTGANLRVVHNSPGAPAVDVVVDINSTPADENLKIITGLAYGESEGYLTPAVAAVSYNVGVRISPNGDIDVLNFDADLMPGVGYTVLANDTVSNISQWVLIDDYRPVVTESKVRLVHGSPSAGIVDIYVFSSADNLLPADADMPNFPSVSFGTETGFVSLQPGDYDIYITGEGSDVPAISVTGLGVTAGGVYTAIARDPDPLDPMDTELGVTLIADEL